MKILGFDFFLVEKRVMMISPFLRSKIKEKLKTNGRYDTARMLTFKNKISSELINKLIQKYKFIDKDYYRMVKKYNKSWTVNLLKANCWKSKDAKISINRICEAFENQKGE